MSGYGSLPMTGAVVTIGSVVIGQVWVLVAGVVLLLGAAFIGRKFFRHNRSMSEV